MAISKKLTVALAALMLATATSGQAQAHSYHHFGVTLGIGLAVGALVGATAASKAHYAASVYRCGFVERYDRWGYRHLFKVYDYYQP